MTDGFTPGADRAGAALRHPVTLIALALWLINDHVLKGPGPGWLTGKLSDIACLIVVPLIPVALIELIESRGGKAWKRRPLLLRVSVAFTALVMATINVFDVAATMYRYGLAVLQWPVRQVLVFAMHGSAGGYQPVNLTMDPTDLWTIPAVLIPFWIVRRSPFAHQPAPQSNGHATVA